MSSIRSGLQVLDRSRDATLERWCRAAKPFQHSSHGRDRVVVAEIANTAVALERARFVTEQQLALREVGPRPAVAAALTTHLTRDRRHRLLDKRQLRAQAWASDSIGSVIASTRLYELITSSEGDSS